METYAKQLQRRERKIKQAIKRQKEMIRLRRAGKTMQEIGVRYGLTRARISQILQMAQKSSGSK
jgi:DNA-binding CsgD family transcriptional regulator